jgi:hypothetical protein
MMVSLVEKKRRPEPTGSQEYHCAHDGRRKRARIARQPSPLPFA